MSEKSKRTKCKTSTHAAPGAPSSITLKINFEKIEEKPTASEPQIVADQSSRHPIPAHLPFRAINASRLADACENAAKVPDLSDLLTWKEAILDNPHHFLDLLFPRFAVFLSAPPKGFGLKVARAVLATWHLRDHAEQRNPSGWDKLGVAALDVVSNAVAVWHIFQCPCCGRALRDHYGEVWPNLRTTSVHREADSLRSYHLSPPALCIFDCGFPLRVPSWFSAALKLSFPHSPETCKEALPLARIVAREYLWRCLKQRYDGADPRCRVGSVVKQLFDSASRSQRLPKSSPGEQAGSVIRDGATEIMRGYQRAAKAGIAGAGLGIVHYKGHMVFTVA